MMTMMNTTELATALDTTPRTLRKFLRAEGAGVGKGSRYALPSSKREVASLAKRFTAWSEAREAKVDEVNDSPDA
jgi:phage antirepressor YoqD-like protein